MNRMLWLWITVFLVTSIVASAEGDPNTQKLKVQLPSNVVKGFPIILRYLVSGETQAPTASLFSITAELLVVFKNKNSGKTYKLAGFNQGEGKSLTTAEGESTDASAQYRIYIKENDIRAFIVDLSSFTTRSNSNVFNDIEEGDYIVTVQFPFSKIVSNQVPLHISLPTENESKVLQQTFGAGSTSNSWTTCLLQKSGSIQILNWNALSDAAKSQLAFHRILAEKTLLPNKNVDEALKFLPEVLRGENACASLELLMFKGESEHFKLKESEVRNNFPEIKWVLDAIHAKERVFMRASPNN